MDSFKKIISLNQASKISGYSQDYLGYLIRQGDIKGTKKGKTWFTTEEEINDYIFKKKIRREELALGDFFSPTRTKNIVISTIIIFIVSFLLFTYINKNRKEKVQEIKSAENSDGDSLKIDIKK